MSTPRWTGEAKVYARNTAGIIIVFAAGMIVIVAATIVIDPLTIRIASIIIVGAAITFSA